MREEKTNLQCGFLGKTPPRPLLLVVGNVGLVDIAQEVQGEFHFREVHFLQQSHTQHA